MATSNYLLTIAIFASLGTFLYGFDTGIATTTIAHQSWVEYMGHPPEGLTGAVASVYISGELVGGIAQTVLGDKMGRKGYLTFCCFFVTLGTCIQTGSQGMPSFLAGRGLAGIGVGGFIGTVTVYLSELASGHHRGLVTGIAGCGISCGAMASNWVGLACSFLPFGERQWRLPLAMQIPWGVILFCGLWTFMPESPRHSVRRGKYVEARKAFERVSSKQLSTYERDQEFETMVSRINYESRQQLSYKQIFRHYRRRALVSIGSQAWTMTTGPAVILYYQTTLYKNLGMDRTMVLVLTGVYGTIALTANLIAIYWLGDRMGRRTHFLLGLAGVSAVLTYTAIMTWRFQDTDNKVGKAFAILGIYMFAVCFNGLLNSSSWTYCSEVCPLEIRSKVVGLASCGHFIINIALTEAGPTAFETIKQNYYYVFVGCSIVAWFVVYFYYPETRNKTLEDIGIEFGDKPLGGEHVVTMESLSDKDSPSGSERQPTRDVHVRDEL